MSSQNTPIGLIAGRGKFPLIFAQESRKHNRELVVIGLKEELNEDLSPLARSIHMVSAGKLNTIIQTLKKEGVEEVAMAGQVKHTRLFSDIIPDLRAAQVLLKIKDRRSDSILTAVADELKKDQLRLIPSTTFLSHLIPGPGVLTKHHPSKSDEKNIQFGMKMARGLAALDLGQTVVVKRRAAVAIEALEGTNECIRRAGVLAGENVIVVKSAKPNQDLRFDVPVIGRHTIEVMNEVQSKVLAIEADKTLILEKEACIQEANQSGIAIVAIPREPSYGAN